MQPYKESQWNRDSDFRSFMCSFYPKATFIDIIYFKSLSSFPTGEVPLLQFFRLRWWFFSFIFFFSYVAFVLSLFVPHLSFLWCNWRAVPFPDCGISWVSLLNFFTVAVVKCCVPAVVSHSLLHKSALFIIIIIIIIIIILVCSRLRDLWQTPCTVDNSVMVNNDASIFKDTIKMRLKVSPPIFNFIAPA